ncbi:MAG: hypothetical protein ACLFVP_06125 [Candidatus Bathyarchaeia archaeon]
MRSGEQTNSVLKEILKIDRKIKSITSDSDYRQIKKNIDILKNRRFGNRSMTIPLPEDMTQSVEVRRHSDEIKNIIKRYEAKETEFKERLNKLYKKRRELKKKLFS